jgi:uncharacterized membrane protein
MAGWLPTRPLRWRPLWLGIGWALVAAVIFISLTPRMPRIDADIMHLDKLGHFTAYFVVMSWFGFIYLRNAHLWIAGLLIAMGLGLEIAQHLSGYRAFEWADMAANASGVLAGLLLARSRFAGLLTLFERRLDMPGG